ncbi:MAG: hypothetical protein AAGG69_00675 [Pseudomonadota bacterium]
MASETYTPNPLAVGDFPHKTHPLSLSGSGTIPAGTPIKSADGLAGTVASELADIPTTIAVTAFDVDVSGGAVEVNCFVSGEMSQSAMTLGNITASALNASLRTRGLPLFIV